jgi:NCS1 family nucleobase:cation symporter-1
VLLSLSLFLILSSSKFSNKPLFEVLLSDFLFVRKGLSRSYKGKAFNITHLYKPHGLYWYHHGWNWRALSALLTGVIPLLPGLAHAINPALSMGRGILEFYSMSWLDGLVFSG